MKKLELITETNGQRSHVDVWRVNGRTTLSVSTNYEGYTHLNRDDVEQLHLFLKEVLADMEQEDGE